MSVSPFKQALRVALVLACTSSCQVPQMFGGKPQDVAIAPPTDKGLLPFQGPASAEPAKLYSRDGGVVSAAQPGSVTPNSDAPTAVAPESGSRMKVIELYQQVVEERDRLRKELGDLAAALAKSQQRIEELQRDVRTKDGAAGLSGQERDQLLAENADLAARLATAQIRRLEAEKALLEHMVASAEAADGEPGADEHADAGKDAARAAASHAEVAANGKHL